MGTVLILTKQDLQKAHVTYISDSSLRSELRFGQYIWNKFGVKGKTWPLLYYETDGGRAYNMAYMEAK